MKKPTKKPTKKKAVRVSTKQRQRLVAKGRDQGYAQAVAECLRVRGSDAAEMIFTPYFGDIGSDKARKIILNCGADDFDLKILRERNFI